MIIYSGKLKEISDGYIIYELGFLDLINEKEMRL